MEYDTIAAIATPAGSGGIGIIKISGINAISIATSIFKRSSKRTPHFFGSNEHHQSLEFPLYTEKYTDLSERRAPVSSDRVLKFDNGETIQSHRLYHGKVINPKNKKPVDDVLLSVMISPDSYTREDVVEINAHSGPLVLRTIMDIVLSEGARLAETGEFTKRAFLNGRIDLTQAEAVIDLINAKSQKALQIANVQADGEMRLYLQNIINLLTDILVKIEAAIDFPEEAEILDLKDNICAIENDIIKKLKELVADYENGHVLRDGLRIVITGRPNVGKSSLMNRLLKKDHAIVTSVPGTTRDVLEETLIVSGIHTIITDTAGLHDSDDPVEIIGIKKARDKIKKADIVLFMVDAQSPFIKTDYEIYESIKDKDVIVVINKIDLVSEDFSTAEIYGLEKLPVVKISARYNIGIDSLKEMINNIFKNKTDLYSGEIIPNLRQKTALDNSIKSVYSFINGLQSGLPFDILCIDLKDSIDYLKDVIGLNIKEDILDHIFSRFCVGK
jgi:tRNA modification GTPase